MCVIGVGEGLRGLPLVHLLESDFLDSGHSAFPCAGSQGYSGQQSCPHSLSDKPIWPGPGSGLTCFVVDREPAAELACAKPRARVQGQQLELEFAAVPYRTDCALQPERDAAHSVNSPGSSQCAQGPVYSLALRDFPPDSLTPSPPPPPTPSLRTLLPSDPSTLTWGLLCQSVPSFLSAPLGLSFWWCSRCQSSAIQDLGLPLALSYLLPGSPQMTGLGGAPLGNLHDGRGGGEEVKFKKSVGVIMLPVSSLWTKLCKIVLKAFV